MYVVYHDTSARSLLYLGVIISQNQKIRILVTMDWTSFTSDVAAWGESAKKSLSDATAQAQAKLEEVQLRTQPHVVIGARRLAKLKKLAEVCLCSNH